MKFLQKQWVAVLLCIAMVIVAVGVHISRNQDRNPPETEITENASSYLQYIYDNGTLSDQTIRFISEYQASMDHSYGSICAVAIVEQLDGESMEETAGEIADRMRLRSMDCLLVLNAADEDWYFLYKNEFSYYVNSELEAFVYEEMENVFGDLNRSIPAFYRGLDDWYADFVADTDSSSDAALSSAGAIAFGMLVLILFIVIIVVSLSSHMRRPMFFRSSPAFFFGMPRYRANFRGFPFHGPGPNSVHRKPPSRPSGSFGSGRQGGFGGSSGGRRGGFGK